MEDLSYNGNNPGSVKYGNFINYYQFHSATERVELLPTNIWDRCDSFVALDVGCNAGDLTISLYKYLTENVCRNCKIIGVDIDHVLIKRANEKNISNNITFECIDFMDIKERNSLIKRYQRLLNINKFNAVFCFSITMWIHLNHGDIGLEQFLNEICVLSDIIIVEPQPWKCYKSAVKRMKLYQKEFPYFKDLTLKDPNKDIEQLICQQSYHKIKEVYENAWKRKIFIFKKIYC